jgi:glycine/D-amino acid oxidase-like deaminating enzyme
VRDGRQAEAAREHLVDAQDHRSLGGSMGAHPTSRGAVTPMKITVVGSGFVGQTTAMRVLEKGLADEVVPGEDVEAAIDQVATELTAAGRIGLSANRAMLRMAQEPLDRFRVYMSAYAREQAKCLYSSALIDNLERSWAARRRAD